MTGLHLRPRDERIRDVTTKITKIIIIIIKITIIIGNDIIMMSRDNISHQILLRNDITKLYSSWTITIRNNVNQK